jgi:hypothetical protein
LAARGWWLVPSGCRYRVVLARRALRQPHAAIPARRTIDSCCWARMVILIRVV